MAKKTPTKQISEAAKIMKKVMRENLGKISENLIDQLMKRARKATPAQRVNASKDLTPRGLREYKAMMLELMAALALDAIDQAHKEVPKIKKIKLAEIDKLPPELRRKIKNRNDLLVGKQIADLLAVIEFAYANNQDTIDSDDIVEDDVRDSAVGWLDGAALTAGADVTASTVINEARDAFFTEPDVEEEIEAYQFVNGDPVTPICKDLAGTVFAKDDPNRFRYTPPLHWNCKSYIRPILKGNLGNKEIQKLKPSSQKIEDSIQFSEETQLFCSCKA